MSQESKKDLEEELSDKTGVWLCSDFKAGEGEVAVELNIIEREETSTWFEFVPASEVGDRRVIKCSVCGKPAIVIDHFFPYYTEHNRCEDHRFGKEKLPDLEEPK